jgi:hypothetical protein
MVDGSREVALFARCPPETERSPPEKDGIAADATMGEGCLEVVTRLFDVAGR